MGKNTVLGLTIFAMALPISIFHITDTGASITYIVGLFYSYFRASAAFGPFTLSVSDSGILEFPDMDGTYSETSFFSQDAWEQVWGTDDGQTMMILWAATLALAALAFIIAIFDPKTGGIFLIFAAISSLAFTILGYTVLDDLFAGGTIYPIPVATLFFLIAGIIALRTEEF